jgi:hypothetical protein
MTPAALRSLARLRDRHPQKHLEPPQEGDAGALTVRSACGRVVAEVAADGVVLERDLTGGVPGTVRVFDGDGAERTE